MKLVDYSDSDSSSDSEQPPHSPPPAPKPHHATLPSKPKKQIIVDFPKPVKDEEPGPRKRRRHEAGGGGGGGLFAVLPAPKRSKLSGASGSGGANGNGNGTGNGNGINSGNGNSDTMEDPGETDGYMGEETILESETAGPAPATLTTGFVPRSTMSKKGKNSAKPVTTEPPVTTTKLSSPINLFPLVSDLASSKLTTSPANPSTYQPLISQPLEPDPLPYQNPQDPLNPQSIPPDPITPQSTLTTIDTSTLHPLASHILEGRHRKHRTLQVTDYNAGEIYAQNALDKMTGALQEQVAPVRAIGSGRHQLSQLLNNVQDQRESLEEAFAKGRRVKKESGAKYGW
jgi:Mitotic checkpoint regulator, MAD2B-interacting